MVASIKKPPNPPRRCVFCGGTPISKEHVWAQWMRPYLPPGQGTQVIQEGRFFENSSTVRAGPLNRKGDLRSQKLKVVCKPCNEGWMGTIQQKTKPILLPLLTREHGAIVADEREILATWVTMFTFVYAVSAPEYTTQNDSQRRAFMESRSPPTPWTYWCGPFDGLSSPTIHFGVANSKTLVPLSSRAEAADIPVAHVTLCGAGGICFAICGTNAQDRFEPFSRLVATAVTQAGFVPLWPADGPYIRVGARRATPFRAMDLLSIRDTIAHAVHRGKLEERTRTRA